MKKGINDIDFLLSIGDHGEFDCEEKNEIETKKNSKNIIINTEKKIEKETSKIDDYWAKSNILPEEIYIKAKNVKDTTELLEILKSVKNYPLKDSAINTVFSSGQPNAKIMIIGEAPGEQEDKKGEPFVGDSGKLMESLLNKAGIFREKNCYISNIIPWRPKNNQTPTLEEIQTCLPFLIKHISIIKPKLILMVGATSTKALTNNPKIKITQTRGNWFIQEFYGHKVQMLATYHPSFLLRQPQQKKAFWQDLMKLQNAAKILN